MMDMIYYFQYVVFLHCFIFSLRLHSLVHPAVQNGLLLLSMNSFVVLHLEIRGVLKSSSLRLE